jgi:hypothetical protein
MTKYKITAWQDHKDPDHCGWVIDGKSYTRSEVIEATTKGGVNDLFGDEVGEWLHECCEHDKNIVAWIDRIVQFEKKILTFIEGFADKQRQLENLVLGTRCNKPWPLDLDFSTLEKVESIEGGIVLHVDGGNIKYKIPLMVAMEDVTSFGG